MTGIREVIAAYYPAIDRVDTDWVMSIFAKDASYRRADADYPDLAAIRKFFSEERRIRGRHLIDEMWSDEQTRAVFVTGRFEGQGAAGDARAVDFADVWHFNDAGQVSRRQTFLGLGHAYVER